MLNADKINFINRCIIRFFHRNNYKVISFDCRHNQRLKNVFMG